MISLFSEFSAVMHLQSAFTQMSNNTMTYLFAIADLTGKKVEDEAKSMFGTYQQGESGIGHAFPTWMKLSAATMRIRRARGVNPAEQPLLESGTMKSLVHASPPIRSGPEEVTVAIGYLSNGLSKRGKPYELFQELGTSRMVARPVMGPAAIRVMREAGGLFKDITLGFFSMLTPGRGDVFANLANTLATGAGGYRNVTHDTVMGSSPSGRGGRTVYHTVDVSGSESGGRGDD